MGKGDSPPPPRGGMRHARSPHQAARSRSAHAAPACRPGMTSVELPGFGGVGCAGGAGQRTLSTSRRGGNLLARMATIATIAHCVGGAESFTAAAAAGIACKGVAGSVLLGSTQRSAPAWGAGCGGVGRRGELAAALELGGLWSRRVREFPHAPALFTEQLGLRPLESASSVSSLLRSHDVVYSSLIGCTSCIAQSFRSRSSFISRRLWTP